MTDYLNETGLYWQAAGGNNIDQISGHCYQYTSVVKKGNKTENTTIIIDIGKFDNYQALGVANVSAAIPDIRSLLNVKDSPLKAIFITHSHPDHLNGVVHYLKAGYQLPTLYAGRYTFMILEDLYREFNIPRDLRPAQQIIDDGDKIKIGSLELEVLASSHTCFDSYGFVIKSHHATIYHSGDMKIDSSTYFRKPTNIKRLQERAAEIDYVVADFYGIYDDGFATKEVTTFKKLVSLLKRIRQPKVFIPVYPTHPEMYIIAFLAALKRRKNVVFFGNPDFESYLQLIRQYGIDFDRLAKGRIRVVYGHEKQDLKELHDNYVVIGTYNHVSQAFEANSGNCFGIITAKTFFNPFKGQLNAHNIQFVTVDNCPELQGFGHGFLGDYEYLNSLLRNPTFIPTHCPSYVIDNFRELAEFTGMKLIEVTPRNGEVYKLNDKGCLKVHSVPAKWLAVQYNNNLATLVEVPQKATSGEGFLKRTISDKRCRKRFKMFLHARKVKSHANQ